jgi:hypothetical protein
LRPRTNTIEGKKIAYSRPIPTPSDTRRNNALMQFFFRLSVVFSEHYRRLPTGYFCLGVFTRYTIMAAGKRKPKRGAYLGD